MGDIVAAFQKQNKITDAGAIETRDNRLRIETTGSFSNLDEIENLTITSRSGENFRLGDIAVLSESYVRPERNKMKVDNVPALGIAISTVADV